jgi:hypothetical protein
MTVEERAGNPGNKCLGAVVSEDPLAHLPAGRVSSLLSGGSATAGLEQNSSWYWNQWCSRGGGLQEGGGLHLALG